MVTRVSGGDLSKTEEVAGFADGDRKAPKCVTFCEDESFLSHLMSLYLDPLLCEFWRFSRDFPVTLQTESRDDREGAPGNFQ